MKEAKMLPKFRFRAWIDKDESQWKKLDIQCIDTVSFGLFLARIHQAHAISPVDTNPGGGAMQVAVRVAGQTSYNITPSLPAPNACSTLYRGAAQEPEDRAQKIAKRTAGNIQEGT
jgi:hypothetical protein